METMSCECVGATSFLGVKKRSSSLRVDRRKFGRRIIGAVAIAGAISVAKVEAAGVVFDNWSAVDNGVTGAGAFTSTGVPDSFIGSAVQLAPGTTDITGLDLFPINRTNASNINSNLNFSSIKLNIYFWGAANVGVVNASNPAFSNPLNATPYSYFIKGIGGFAPGYYFNLENGLAPHVLPGLTLPAPLVVPNAAIGMTVEVQGSFDDTTYADYPGLSTLVAGGSVAPAVGSDVLEGWYRNANSETNGNFTSTLRTAASVGDAYVSLGTDIYGDGPATTYTWTNASSGTSVATQPQWTDVNNWNPLGTPGGNDTAVFNLSQSTVHIVQIPSFVSDTNTQVFNDNVAFNLPNTLSQTYFSGALTVGQSNTASGTTVGSLLLNNSSNTTTSIVEAGTFVIGGNGGTGTLTVDVGVYAYSDSDTSIGAGSKLTILLGGKLGTGTLTFAGSTNAWTGQLDIGTSHLVVRNGSIGTITNQLKTGFANGAWNGQGIISSFAAVDSTHLTAIGAIVNNDGSGNQIYGNTSTGTLGLFDGENPDLNAVLLKYTYYGDTNLDGSVDGTDYSRIDNGFLNHLSGWFNGDFNYDGVVDGSDYTLIDNTFNMQQGGTILPNALLGQTSTDYGALDARLAAGLKTSGTYNLQAVPLGGPNAFSTAQIASSAVPEPLSLGMLAVAVPLLGRASRRRKSLSN